MTPPITNDARRFAGQLGLITAAAAVLRLVALPGQPPLADDLSTGISAINFVERAQIGPTMWQHPRLRDLLVYLSTSIAGVSKLSLVLPSLLLGIATIPIVGLLTRRLGGARAGLVAALLLCIDPLHVDYSRQAVQEVYTGFFGAVGVLAVLRHLDTRRARWALVAGLAFGLGLASKWSVLFPLSVAFGWSSWRLARDSESEASVRRANLALLFATLILLPAATYLATWAPWFEGGRGLVDWLDLHRAMVTEATRHAGFNPADAEMPRRAILWFLWPVYYADSAFGPSGPLPIIAISNPLVWLATLPAVTLLALAARREGEQERAILPALVLATWLPFTFASRPIWLHSALAVLPFALSAVASAASTLAGSAPGGRRKLVTYAVVATVAAAPLYLLATGIAIDVPGLREVALSYRPAPSLEPGPPP